MTLPINDKNTPVTMPDNEWTRMVEAVRTRNERGVALSNEEIASGVPMTGTPLPASRSAELGRPARVPTVPVVKATPEEIAEINKAAVEAGFIPPEALTEDMGPYASMEDAIAAGSPLGLDEDTIRDRAAQFREPVPVRPPVGGRQTAREFMGPPVREAGPSMPRLPDFKKVQMIDLVNGKVYVDGLEFALDEAESKTLRKFCVTKAKTQIQKALDAALKDLAEDVDGGTEAV